MAADRSRSASDLSRVVEKQMRNWELARAQSRGPRPHAAPRDVADFVTISRTMTSGGTHVATLLGERLGWPILTLECDRPGPLDGALHPRQE